MDGARKSSSWDRLNVVGRVPPPWVPALVMAATLFVYFWPFLTRGEHAVPFHFESPAVTGMATAGAPRTIHQRFPDHDDSPVLIAYPNAVLSSMALRCGELPVWNPYVGCGAPAMAGGQVFPFSPFLWPFYLWPSPRLYTFALMAQLLWMAWGAYLWLGFLVSGRASRILGSLLCACNPWTAQIFIFSNMGSACWLGWILWAWHKALDDPKRLWWLPGTLISLSCYSGHPETALLLAVASAVYAATAWAVRSKHRRAAPVFLAMTGGTVFLSVLLSAAQWLPVLAGLPEAVAYKFQGPSANVTPGHYLLTNLFNPREPVFVNPVLWGLLFLGGVTALRARRLWPVVALAAVGTQLAFWAVRIGALVRWQTIGGVLPGIYARGAFWFAIGALAAVGAGALITGDGGRWFPARLLLLGLVAFVALSWADYQDGAMIYLFLRRDLMIFYAALALPLLALTPARRGPVRDLALCGVFVAVVLAPLVDQGFRYNYFSATEIGKEKVPAVAALQAEKPDPHGRIAGFITTGDARPCFSPNLATLWALRDARLLDVLQSRRLWSLQDALGAQRHRLLRTFVAFPGMEPEGWALLAVRYLAVADKNREGGLRWEPVPGASPRAFIVHHLEKAQDEAASEEAMKAKDLENGDAPIVVEGWPGPERVGAPTPEDGVQWLSDHLSRVKLRVTAPKGGVLVLLDTFASGWRATVDGRPARIYPANLAFRAVQVPPGCHEVDFLYRPWAVRAGLALSGAGWLAVLSLAVWAWKRRG